MGTIAYKIALILHLISLTIYLGYLVFDVVIMRFIVNKLSNEDREAFFNAIEKVSSRYMPLMAMIMIFSGWYMLSKKFKIIVNFDTNMLVMFATKLFSASVVFLIVTFGIVGSLVIKYSMSIRNTAHSIILFFGLLAVLMAKIMFYL